jgi:hypothetical protein
VGASKLAPCRASVHGCSPREAAAVPTPKNKFRSGKLVSGVGERATFFDTCSGPTVLDAFVKQQ